MVTLIILRPPAAVSNAALHMHSKMSKLISAKIQIRRKTNLFNFLLAILLPDYTLSKAALLRMRYLILSTQMSTF